MIVIVLIFFAVIIHVVASFLSEDIWPLLIYIRNQFIGFGLLLSSVQVLNFLSFHHLFGPWAIIIQSLIIDLGKFVTVLMLFEFGFSMLINGMNQGYTTATDLSGSEQVEKVFAENPRKSKSFAKFFVPACGRVTRMNYV